MMKKKGKGKWESQLRISLTWDEQQHIESLIRIESQMAQLHTDKAATLKQYLEFIRLSDMADNNPVKTKVRKGK